MKAPKLSNKRKQYADARQHGLLVGTAIRPSMAVANEYQKRLDKLIDEMAASTLYKLNAGFNLSPEPPVVAMDSTAQTLAERIAELREKWVQRFTESASVIISAWLSGVDRSTSQQMSGSLSKIAGKPVKIERSVVKSTEANGSQLTQAQKAASAASAASGISAVKETPTLKELSIGLTLKTDKMSKGLTDALEAATVENVGLIRNIPQQFYERIEGAVMRSLQPSGGGQSAIYDEVTKIKGMAKRRAELIARDQTRKATATIQVEKAAANGYTKFKWIHSGGGMEPRKLHLDYNGEIFEYANPPVIDKRTGERGYPGQAINCRCVAVPVVEW